MLLEEGCASFFFAFFTCFVSSDEKKVFCMMSAEASKSTANRKNFHHESLLTQVAVLSNAILSHASVFRKADLSISCVLGSILTRLIVLMPT